MGIGAILNDRCYRDATNKLSCIRKDIEEKPIVIFGCGNLGKKISSYLLTQKCNIVAFTDNNEHKWGMELTGIPILSPTDVADKFANDAVFIVCVWSPERSYAIFKGQLDDLGVTNIVHAASIMLLFPDDLLPYYHFQLPGFYLKHKNEIEAVYNMLADEESKLQYLAHVNCRFTLNFEGLPPADTKNQYFPAGIINLGNKEVFFDAGAYNGDTLADFCERTKNVYSRYIALEPDPANFIHLQEMIVSVDAHDVDTYLYAVGKESCQLKFDANGGGSAGLSEGGDIEVTCVRIDDKFGDVAPTYLKFDIEGAELDALEGSHNTIEKYKPVMAICIYHLPDDLWTLPLYVKKKYPFYNIYVRTHQYDGLDFVMYAIPE